MVPSLTIAIPVFERTFGFEEALESALAVKGCNEIVVVDDLSSHCEFSQICAAKKDSRIRYVKNVENLGLFGNWNQCASLASGDFVAILCSDDVISPDIYSWFQEAIIHMPDLDVFFGAFGVFSTSVSQARIFRSYPTGPVSSQKLLEDAIVLGVAFPVLSVIRKTKLLEFPFISKPHSGNDWLWIYSNASFFKLFADSRPLSFWRRHPKQDSKTSVSITTDCWPLMYSEISNQLRKYDSDKSRRADEKSKGVILSWLLNDKNRKGYYRERLLGPEAVGNPFLCKAKSIVDQNWLLSGLLTAGIMRPFYYNLGRLFRKLKIYPSY